MRKYWNFNKGIRQLENWESGCWIQVTCPVENDVKYLIEELQIPDYFIEDISNGRNSLRNLQQNIELRENIFYSISIFF